MEKCPDSRATPSRRKCVKYVPKPHVSSFEPSTLKKESLQVVSQKTQRHRDLFVPHLLLLPPPFGLLLALPLLGTARQLLLFHKERRGWQADKGSARIPGCAPTALWLRASREPSPPWPSSQSSGSTEGRTRTLLDEWCITGPPPRAQSSPPPSPCSSFLQGPPRRLEVVGGRRERGGEGEEGGGEVVVVVVVLTCVSSSMPTGSPNYGGHVPVDLASPAMHLCEGPQKSYPSTSVPDHGEREHIPCPHKRSRSPTRETRR